MVGSVPHRICLWGLVIEPHQWPLHGQPCSPQLSTAACGHLGINHIPCQKRWCWLLNCSQPFLNLYPKHQAGTGVAQCPAPMSGVHLRPLSQHRQAAKAVLIWARKTSWLELLAWAVQPALCTTLLAHFVLPLHLLGPGTISGSFCFIQ